jgi:superoxide dismutase, Fe-Mn family
MTRFVLPDLPYEPAALEPHISGKVMELHHDKHHRAYVQGANQAIEQLLEARHQRKFDQIAAIERKLAFNVSGHVLHSIFWQNLSPEGGGRPGGVLATAIDRDFGGFDIFRRQITAAAGQTMGSGWAALTWDPIVKRLGTTLIHDHQSEVTQGGVTLMVIDAWEHAYYLQYKNVKDDYFEAIWNLWNWDDISHRFDLARRVELGLTDLAEEAPQAVH